MIRIESMRKTIFELAKEYLAVIEEIERTTDAKKLQSLEEKRVKLHGFWMDLLKEQGIAYRDREHATKIAIKIARGEL